MGSQSYEGLLKRREHLTRRLITLVAAARQPGRSITVQQARHLQRLQQTWELLHERIQAYEARVALEAREEARIAQMDAEE